MTTQTTTCDISRIDKRTIEACAIVPVLEALEPTVPMRDLIGTLQQANEKEAFQRGRAMGVSCREHVIAALVRDVAGWGEGGTWEMDILELTETTFHFNVTRCPYHDRYKELGLEAFGVALSCCRDKPFARGFHPSLKLERTRTIMEGHDHCDFRYSLQENRRKPRLKEKQGGMD